MRSGKKTRERKKSKRFCERNRENIENFPSFPRVCFEGKCRAFTENFPRERNCIVNK